jgi:putative membrane protein
MTRSLLRVASLFLAAAPSALLAADPSAPSTGWHAQTLGQAIGYLALFTAIGIFLAIVGYKVFDRCTPGHLHKEIVEHRNVAAAIIGGSVILGVCIIIAAAMLG